MTASRMCRHVFVVGRSTSIRMGLGVTALALLVPVQVAAHASGGTTTGADLQISGSASSGSQAPGAAYTYTYQVKNSGPQTATGATFTNPLNRGVTVTSAYVNGNISACSLTTDSTGLTTVTCALGDMPSSSQLIVTEDAFAPTVAGTYYDSPFVASTVSDPNATNNEFTVAIKVSGSTAPPLVNGPCAKMTTQNPLPLLQNFNLVTLKATITSCSALTQTDLAVAFNGGAVLDGWVFTCNAPQDLVTGIAGSYTLTPGASTTATCKSLGEVNATQGALGSTASGIGTATLYADCESSLLSVSSNFQLPCTTVLATGTYAWSVNVPVVLPPNGNH